MLRILLVLVRKEGLPPPFSLLAGDSNSRPPPPHHHLSTHPWCCIIHSQDSLDQVSALCWNNYNIFTEASYNPNSIKWKGCTHYWRWNWTPTRLCKSMNSGKQFARKKETTSLQCMYTSLLVYSWQGIWTIIILNLSCWVQCHCWMGTNFYCVPLGDDDDVCMCCCWLV